MPFVNISVTPKTREEVKEIMQKMNHEQDRKNVSYNEVVRATIAAHKELNK